MVIDNEKERFAILQNKSKYLKECLWRGKFKKGVRRKKEATGGQRLLF